MFDYSLIGFVINTITIIVAVVWAIAKIKGTTDVLSNTIEHLAGEVSHLRTWLGDTATDLKNHGERLIRIETKLDTEVAERRKDSVSK